ncbi:Threonine/homoserine efflux transporter RhtA [Malonomonas rubra DSM 5091]|uniref:Threonine/homoserine efflux transporter RhtA n=1 Tax=Malonomonas rubra DSM 5091 TaxID=1122189 RepID=A0A1M6HDQ6_MALRU|nr:DMT family transporter [Malonomonas rubra]SHJ20315.1 Threonine/homoserine efflux transporter RhtA [Malonomonas rubra DSM 5091]
MANFLFYTFTVLIWGSTWLAIKFQLGTVAPALSIFYRFALAAVMLFLWCLLTKRALRFSRNDHLFMALQGSQLFALNYLFFYLAELSITSGLAAVVFSTILVMNLINGRLFLGTPVELKVLLGGLLGLFGLVLMFWPEVTHFDAGGDALLGLGYCFLATYLASLGNIISARNQQKGLPVVQTNAFGMAYGAALMFLISFVTAAPLSIETSFSYLASLFYLALFGSVIAFGCYLSLVGRIGAGRAAYATLLFPLVALLLSTIWEDYQWTAPAVVGILLILGGNYLAMVKRKPAPVSVELDEVGAES